MLCSVCYARYSMDAVHITQASHKQVTETIKGE